MDSASALGISFTGGYLIYRCTTEILRWSAHQRKGESSCDPEPQDNMEDVVRRISDPVHPERYYKTNQQQSNDLH